MKSWRKVFWRLWGMCHALYCSLCSSYFPVYMHEFCTFHPQDPDFAPIQFKTSTQPFGSFTCCQMPVYRFQPLPANQRVSCTMLQKISKCEVNAWLCWNLMILPPLWFCVKSHFGEFKQSKNVIYSNFRVAELWVLVKGLESCYDLQKIKIQNL